MARAVALLMGWHRGAGPVYLQSVTVKEDASHDCGHTEQGQDQQAYGPTCCDFSGLGQSSILYHSSYTVRAPQLFRHDETRTAQHSTGETSILTD